MPGKKFLNSHSVKAPMLEEAQEVFVQSKFGFGSSKCVKGVWLCQLQYWDGARGEKVEEKYKKAKKTGDLDGFVASWRRCLENRGSGRETSTCIHWQNPHSHQVFFLFFFITFFQQ